MGQNQELLKIFENELKKSSLSRREALKVLGFASSILLTSELKAEEKHSSDTKVDIVIIGGGLAGISTAARLKNSLENANISIIEPNNKSLSYQPGNSFEAVGLNKKEDNEYYTRNFIPKGTTLLVDKAMEFDPENNKVLTKKGLTLSYDFLVVAAGLVLDFAKIKGLEELNNIHSLDENEKIRKYFKNTNISSIYNKQAAKYTWQNIQKQLEEAKTGKKINTIFTHPKEAIKYPIGSKEIMYLTNCRIDENNLKENFELTYYTYSQNLFKIKPYEEKIIEQFNKRDMNYKLAHELKEVDIKNNIAIFDNYWEEKGEYNEDLEEYKIITKHQKVEVPYHFLHLTPPMKIAPQIASSALASKTGKLKVDKKTLQHKKYNNIFSLGDIIDVPFAKTGASIRKQYKIVSDNIVSAIKGKDLNASYNGYTAYAFSTDIGKVMLSEFDWDLKAKPSFPLDPYEERYLWWILKAYLLKPLIMQGMVKGKI